MDSLLRSKLEKVTTWRERLRGLDKPTDFAEAQAAKEEVRELRAILAEQPAAAAGPVDEDGWRDPGLVQSGSTDVLVAIAAGPRTFDPTAFPPAAATKPAAVDGDAITRGTIAATQESARRSPVSECSGDAWRRVVRAALEAAFPALMQQIATLTAERDAAVERATRAEIQCTLVVNGVAETDRIYRENYDAMTAERDAAVQRAERAEALHQQLLDMLGAADHVAAGAAIGELHGAQAECERLRKDAVRLDFVASEYLDLQCYNIPTGGDDYDVGWRVIEHASGGDRTLVEYDADDLRAAIDAAIEREREGGNAT